MKRLSGFQFKQKRKAKIDQQKLSGALKNFLVDTSESETKCPKTDENEGVNIGASTSKQFEFEESEKVSEEEAEKQVS